MTAVSETYVHQVHQMLKEHDQKQSDFWEWVMANGKTYEPDILSPTERLTIRGFKKHFKPKIKECFYNAQMFAVDNSEVRYIEGIATKIIPIEHGWNTINGKLIDLTWDRQGVGVGVDYFGVEIPRSFIMNNIFKKGQTNPLLIEYYIHLKNTMD